MGKNDKRKDTRVHTVHLVSYTKFSPEKVTELMGMANTVDLSEGGMRMTTKEPMEIGQELHLDFEIDGQLIRTDAKVVHVKEVKHYQVGFQFGEGLDKHEQDKIQKFLSAHGFKDKSKDETV
jgi:c-di-GMP-binding flagellar brake protein YcgR